MELSNIRLEGFVTKRKIQDDIFEVRDLGSFLHAGIDVHLPWEF